RTNDSDREQPSVEDQTGNQHWPRSVNARQQTEPEAVRQTRNRNTARPTSRVCRLSLFRPFAFRKTNAHPIVSETRTGRNMGQSFLVFLQDQRLDSLVGLRGHDISVVALARSEEHTS